MVANIAIRIFDQPQFKAYAFETILNESTNLLDKHTLDANNEMVLHGWSPTTIDFWLALLHSADEDDGECLDEFDVTIEQLWSVVSFYERYVRPKKDRDLSTVQQDDVTGDNTKAEEASAATLKLRHWFGGWWKNHASKIREKAPEDLAQLVTPAFYVGDPTVFMDVTHEWFLHTEGKQSSIDVTDPSDEAGQYTLAIHHPMLGKLAAVRSNMINKIEDALAYDEENDGLPRDKRDPGRRGGMTKPRVCQDPEWCPKEKNAAYYTALMATDCWPVGKAMQKRSVYGILSDLQKFNYVPYHRVEHLPDRAVARAKMPSNQKGEGSKENHLEDASKDGDKRKDKTGNEKTCLDAPKDCSGTAKKPCNVCIDGAVKASFDGKIKGLLGRLLDEKQTTVRKEVRPGVWNRARVDDSFKGLCLDCLTKTKFESEDDDYWSHCHNFDFDYGCTVKHGQPTWYFSYMGRPEAMQKWSKTKRK